MVAGMVGWVMVYGFGAVCRCSGLSVEVVNARDSSTSVWFVRWDVLILAGSHSGKRQLRHLVKTGDDLGILLMQHVNHLGHFVILLV